MRKKIVSPFAILLKTHVIMSIEDTRDYVEDTDTQKKMLIEICCSRSVILPKKNVNWDLLLPIFDSAKDVQKKKK